MERFKNISLRLPPLPDFVENINNPVIEINPDWRINDFSDKRSEKLVSEITKDEPFLLDEEGLRYQTYISIPEEFQNKTILLRFNRTGCIATVRVDGKFIRNHYGGHTQWDCDITDVAQNKAGVEVQLNLQDRPGELSPYAKAGVFGSIKLIALPRSYIQSLYTEPVRDSDGNYSLNLYYGTVIGEKEGEYTLKAYISDQNSVDIATADLDINNTRQKIFCGKVQEWDSEHPNLYRLKLRLMNGEKILEETVQNVGFRSIEKNSGQILWNGRPLKLRGINYREPLCDEPYTDIKRDLMLFKQANINYIRGLFYPFSDEFLSLCDEMGFYVENMAPAWEVDSQTRSTQNAPEYRDVYLNQLSEMLQTGLSHVSVTIWSLGSDSTWGSNFREGYRMIKAIDGTRPVNFHFPMSIPEEEPQMDVWSVAHADYRLPLDKHYDTMVIFHTHGSDNPIGYATGSATGYQIPVLHTVFAHLPCHNRDQIERDPGIHEFWGESIKRFWDIMWKTRGTLGGAVMAAVDEDGTFSPRLRDHHWGILNAKHEPKPEYYHIKMAYAPVKVSNIEIKEDKLRFTVENRFNHTNLNEVTAKYVRDGKEKVFQLELAPGEVKTVELSLDPKGEGNRTDICFDYRNIRVYETAVFSQKRELKARAEDVKPESFKITEDDRTIFIENNICSFLFCKKTALMTEGRLDGKLVLCGGPYLQATRLKLEQWVGTWISCTMSEKGARVVLEGRYGKVCSVRFVLDIGINGEIDTLCTILSLSKHMPHTVKAIIGVDPGGLDELGIHYIVPGSFSRLEWRREGLWPVYPDDHIGRPEGLALAENPDDFRSMKHHIYGAILTDPENRTGIKVVSDKTHSIRLEAQPDPDCIIDDRDERIQYHGTWYSMDDYCGNYCDTETLSRTKGDYLEFGFKGTGIKVYGPLDVLHGKCNISIDGNIVAENISQYLSPVDFPGASRGYEKRYRVLLFEITGLEYKEHVMRITVTGEHEAGAQGSYVSIDYFVVEKPDTDGQLKLIINNDYNYTRLVRGNFMRPKVEFKVSDQFGNRIRLIKLKEDGEDL
ncbi:MAG: hypothetical protein GX213_01500 [Clostridiaceae bacterium]|nr:hypothetical protein [Clostridiaceae bacterium]